MVYNYNFLGRHVALLYGTAALFVLAPLPFWIVLLFGYKAQNENAVLVFSLTGIFVALWSIWSDYHDRHLFKTIEIIEGGINSYENEGGVFIHWNDFVSLEYMKYIDIERAKAWGVKGVRITAKNDKKIFIFSTIRDYWGLLKLIEQKTKMAFK